LKIVIAYSYTNKYLNQINRNVNWRRMWAFEMRANS